MKSGDVFEFTLGSDIQELVERLKTEGYEFDDNATAILEKTKKSEPRKCRVIVLDLNALGFHGVEFNRTIIKCGLAVGHKLCHPEVALHMRRLVMGDQEDVSVCIAMKGVFLRRAELHVLSVENHGSSELGEGVQKSVSTEEIANGQAGPDDQEMSSMGEFWVFELA